MFIRMIDKEAVEHYHKNTETAGPGDRNAALKPYLKTDGGACMIDYQQTVSSEVG